MTGDLPAYAEFTGTGEFPTAGVDEPSTQRHEIRSHRNGGDKPVQSGHKEGHADTRELERLLGFFDEIRRARAWDEEEAESGTSPGWAVEDSGGHQPVGAGHSRSRSRRAH
jgi:hypothetical protein